MIAAVATIVFLACLLVLAGIVALILERSGSRILDALAGRTALESVEITPPARAQVRTRVRLQPVLQRQPQWRAAA